MSHILTELVSKELNISIPQVAATVELIQGGATVPFISRYRKEATGSLDEVQIENIRQTFEKFSETIKRKATILDTILSQGLLTDELRKTVEECWNPTKLEDIYLPFKPRRETRAQKARKLGLEPLATKIMAQKEQNLDKYLLESTALISSNEPLTSDQVLQGARDIIAEWVAEDLWARDSVRYVFRNSATITSHVIKGKEAEGEKYRDLFEWNGPLKSCTSHRMLALRRAESQGILKVSITPDLDRCQSQLALHFVAGRGAVSSQVLLAVDDSLKRLLRPSIESEFAAQAKERADNEAIKVFVTNLSQLLLSAPLGQKRVMGVDPGFRSGCKIVCLDQHGVLLDHTVIYPHQPSNDGLRAAKDIKALILKYGIQAIAIGNGTASRESEDFFSSLALSSDIQIFTVSEDGASIYSASAAAREEFPDHDVTVRGAVSIARRLMDPLAELVKIDPKSLGIGQYQHDVDQKELQKSLVTTVESCVNMVGVNVNTASKHLLRYVSGVGPTLAQNIIDYRGLNGAFSSRKEIMKVPRMGSKAYEQCAGFLRISDSANPLDNSAVHPESYAIVERMALDLGCNVAELIGNKELRAALDLSRYITKTAGMPTLVDIVKELDKPGRDPRSEIEVFAFDRSIRTIADLRVGMELPAIVNNITAFGCFVDLGIKENGLIHLSQLADRYVNSAADIVSLHQHVRVRVLDVDLVRGRIQLTMRLGSGGS